MPYQAFYHPHAYFWIVLVLLFFVTFFLYKANVAKGAKIVHMVLRLFYVIMIGTGLVLLTQLHFPVTYILKGVLAISLVYFMEMVLVRTKKGTSDKPMAYYWIMLSVTLMLVLLIGYGVLSF